MEGSLPASPVSGILQERILEWVAMPSSRGSSRPRGRPCVSYASGIGRRVLYHWCHLRSPKVQVGTGKGKLCSVFATSCESQIISKLKVFKKITCDCETRGQTFRQLAWSIGTRWWKGCQGILFLGLLWYSSGKESTFQGRGCRFHPWSGKGAPVSQYLARTYL